jgi:membrane-associated phospholipid phosphatase
MIAAIIALAARGVGPGRRRAFLREVAVVLFAFFAYHAVRSVTEGSVVDALKHAQRLEDLERSIGLFVEPTLQAAIVGEQWLVNMANWVYIWGHWPFIGVAAIWLYRTQPVGYLLYRNAFLISGGIGLMIFMMFPTAPPRLADLNVVDTVVEYSNFYYILQPPQLTNQFAAFPSLHFGWNLLITIAIVRYAPAPAIRTLVVLVPAAMAVSIVVTANHYIVDAIAGGAVAVLGLLLASQLQRRSQAAELAADGEDLSPVLKPLLRRSAALFAPSAGPTYPRQPEPVPGHLRAMVSAEELTYSELIAD